jgi:minor histocompatibility antigen H13
MSSTVPMAASNATSEPGPFLELLGRIAYEAQIMQPLVPTYIHLILSAIFPIYIASHASLNRPPSAVKLSKKERRRTDDDEDDEGARKVESLSPSDALVFPLLAGCTLASLYFLLNWLQDPAWLNWALGIYFSQIGLWFAFIFLKDLLTVIKSFIFPKSYSAGGHVWMVELQERCYKSESGLKCVAPLPGYLRYLRFPGLAERSIWSLRSLMERKALLRFHVRTLVTAKLDVTPLHLAALLTSASIVAYNTFIDKPWYLTNFLGFSFCYGALQFTSPTTGWTGTLVLGALFFYDIYFVFFTPMMVTVATKLDVPIKLLFPRPDGCVVPVGAAEGSAEMEEYFRCIAKKRTMAMLGLGDIVVPGMMIAFALRFDLYLHYLMKQDRKSEVKPEYLPATGGWGESKVVQEDILPRDHIWIHRRHGHDRHHHASSRACSACTPLPCAGSRGYVLGHSALQGAAKDPVEL